MTSGLTQALDLAAAARGGATAAEVGRTFHESLRSFGLRATYTRASGGHLAHEAIYTRISPPGWEETYAREDLAEKNFVTRVARRAIKPFAWSTVRPKSRQGHEIWEVLAHNGFSDGLAVPCHGPGGYFGLVSLGFSGLDDLAPLECRAIELAAMLVHQRQHELAVSGTPIPPLSARERDCLGFVAAGKSDWEIGVILSLAQSTVHSYVENAKRKLGARTRAQAAARAVALGLI